MDILSWHKSNLVMHHTDQLNKLYFAAPKYHVNNADAPFAARNKEDPFRLLRRDLEMTALSSGYSICSNGSGGGKKTSQTSKHRRFVCTHFRHNGSAAGSHSCKFRLHVYFDPTTCFFYIKGGTSNSEHRHHQPLQPHEVTARMNLLSPDDTLSKKEANKENEANVGNDDNVALDDDDSIGSVTVKSKGLYKEMHPLFEEMVKTWDGRASAERLETMRTFFTEQIKEAKKKPCSKTRKRRRLPVVLSQPNKMNKKTRDTKPLR